MGKLSLTLQSAISSLIGLLALNCALLGALFAQVPPNPPGQFGPYISATLALAALSLPLIIWRNRLGYVCSILVGCMCLLSFGPQKFFVEPTAKLLSPVIFLGSILSVVIIISSIMAWRER